MKCLAMFISKWSFPILSTTQSNSFTVLHFCPLWTCKQWSVKESSVTSSPHSVHSNTVLMTFLQTKYGKPSIVTLSHWRAPGSLGLYRFTFAAFPTLRRTSFNASWEFGLTNTGSPATTFTGWLGWFEGTCWNSLLHSEICSFTTTCASSLSSMTNPKWVSFTLWWNWRMGATSAVPRTSVPCTSFSADLRLTLQSGLMHFLLDRSMTVWQTGQTRLPSLASISSTRRSTSSFQPPGVLVCSFSNSSRISWMSSLFCNKWDSNLRNSQILQYRVTDSI